jgi:hypothetical protein
MCMLAIVGLLFLVLSLSAGPSRAEDTAKPIPPERIKFVAHRIGTYRSEACGVGDFNNDGKLDIVAGEFLYLAPEFQPTKIRTIINDTNDEGKGYAWDFMNAPLDVDGDLDIAVTGEFGGPVWFENKAR